MTVSHGQRVGDIHDVLNKKDHRQSFHAKDQGATTLLCRTSDERTRLQRFVRFVRERVSKIVVSGEKRSDNSIDNI